MASKWKFHAELLESGQIIAENLFPNAEYGTTADPARRSYEQPFPAWISAET